jgi:hypothetical protein
MAKQSANNSTGNRVYDDYMSSVSSDDNAYVQQRSPTTTGNSVYDQYMSQQQAQQPEQEQNGIMNFLGNAWDVVKEPASAALEGLSYLDKPRGALAGATVALQNDSPVLEGLQRGWDENTSWKETFNPEWVKENPKTAAVTGFAADVALDPLWFVTPAKIAKGVSEGSKAIGLTDNLINPAVNAARSTEAGQKAIAFAEDALGKNRVADQAFDFNAGRATDQLGADDLVDSVRNLKSQYGEDANKLTDYIEASPVSKSGSLEEKANNSFLSGTKIADEQGKPLTVYHGTNSTFDNFDPNKIASGDRVNRISNLGFFFSSDPQVAANYAQRIGGNIRPSNVSIKNPYIISNVNHIRSITKTPETTEKFKKILQSQGHDGIILSVSGKIDAGAEIIPFSPSQIKSVFKNADTSAIKNSIVSASDSGKLLDEINKGNVTKSEAFNVLRDANKEIPDYLLQNSQRVAKETALSPAKLIPDTITRESVLNSIPDTGLRKAIETIGEQFIKRNKANADALRATGRLSDEAYVSYLDGEHLRRSFEQYETPDKFLEALRKNGTEEEYRRVYQTLNKSKAPGGQGYGAVHKVDTKDFIQRQTLSDDTMKKLGLIKDPEYRIMDTLNRSSKTLREDEYLNRINTVWGKTGDEAADLSRTLPKRRQYVPIPESKAYGALAGKWVPKDIHDQVIKLTGTGASSSELVQGWQKAVSWFKVAKLANPASTMRNFYSGIPMANVFGGLPMQAMPKYMMKATQAMRGGNKSELMREVKGTGILGNVWQKQELRNIIGDKPTGIKKAAEWGMDKFGKPDEFWRVATYAYHRDQGKSIKEAAQIANKALFDYSSAPELINMFSKTGIMPFAKFPYFAGKATLKAAYENPAQLSKFTKAQNQVNNEDREKIMPDYMKSRTLLPLGDGTRTVNGKEQKVQNNLDLSYILPFANDYKFGNPVSDAYLLFKSGKNSLGQQVIKPGMTDAERMKEWANFAYNAIAPSVPLPGNYAGDKLSNAIQGRVDSKGRQYDLPSAFAQSFLGLKNVPINTQELYNQKVTVLTSEQRNIKAVMNQIAKDQSLPKEQKIERLKEHQSQLKELGKELKETNKSWQREKARGN